MPAPGVAPADHGRPDRARARLLPRLDDLRAARRSPTASTRRSPRSARSSPRPSRSAPSSTTSTPTSTPPSTRSKACWSRRPAWRTRSGLVEGLYPGAAAAGLPQLPRQRHDQGAADRRGLHARHADARAARPRGADRRRQPERRPGPAQRPRRQPGGARALSRSSGPAARRSSAPTPPCNTRNAMQTPAPFEYERATSLEGAIASLREHEDSRIVAGGHSLLPMMKLRLAQPSPADRHQRPDGARSTSARRATSSRSGRSRATSSCSSPSCCSSASRSSATPSR